MTRSSSPSDRQPKIYQWDNAAIQNVSPARESCACVHSKKSSPYRDEARSLPSCRVRSQLRLAYMDCDRISHPYRCVRR
jgi:hypothetical protein